MNTGTRRLGWLVLAVCVAACAKNPDTAAPPSVSVVTPTTQPSTLSFLTAHGTHIVDPSGRVVVLRGCNLGNWLLIEPWMLGWSDVRDQHEIEEILRRRFGRERADDWMERYRAGYITDRDFQIIRSFGFNTVRLPLHWSLIQEAAPPFALRPDGFKWLDRAMDMAQAAGLYVIIDMHGVPGGQSDQFHTGEAGQNHFWDSREDQARAVALWSEIAEHCRARAVVGAYDLINEPYGDGREDLREPLLRWCDECYRAIRRVDPKHVIFFPGVMHPQISFYGDPRTRGWEGVGFTEHFYPGLFGQAATLESHALLLNRRLIQRREYLAGAQAPYLLGEFNVVWQSVGRERLMRQYFDRFAAEGWAATMWSYKMLKPEGGIGSENWYMVTNSDPLPPLHLREASLREADDFADRLASMPLAIDQPLRDMLTRRDFVPLALARPTMPPTHAEAGALWPEWSAADIGNAEGGGQTADGNDAITLFGSGSDVYNRYDSFHFVRRTAAGDAQISARIDGLLDTHEYAKAGLMFRASSEPDAVHAMINVFPGADSGGVALCWRAKPGGLTSEIKRYPAEPPKYLRLVRRGVRVSGYGSVDGLTWRLIGETDLPSLPPRCLVGLAVCSHDREYLTSASFRQLRFESLSAASPDPPR